MRMTRRQFGISVLLGFGSILLFGIMSRLGLGSGAGKRPKRARFWRAGDRLAG